MPSLQDPHGRNINYLRISVTDKCNLRCFYCLPKGSKGFYQKDDYLSLHEFQRVMRAFADLGVKRMRLTGGEPLIRPDLIQLVEAINTADVDDISLSTNASLLAEQADDLKAAGVMRINVSLDTLKPDRFLQITGGELAPVIEGLMAAKQAGFESIKINMVVMKGVNEDEVEDLLKFCQTHGFTLRYIETMPVGDGGRTAADQYVDLAEIKQQLEQSQNLIPSTVSGAGPARYFKVENSDLHIGFITPMSQHFCETCNRVRLSADGTLYLCLGKEHTFALRPLLRAGIDDEGLKQAIIEALELKPLKHEFNEKPEHVVRFMSLTGG